MVAPNAASIEKIPNITQHPQASHVPTRMASSGACPFSPSSSFLQALPGLPAPGSLPAVESLVPAGVPDWGKLRKAREDHPVICKGKKAKRRCQKPTGTQSWCESYQTNPF